MSDSPSPNSESPANTSLPVVDPGMDVANQSLADALRVSFWILKVAMVIIVIFFLCSGFFSVGQSQVALVLRFGSVTELSSGEKARRPGFQVALPDPVDEKIILPTDQRSLIVDTFDASQSHGQLQPGVDGYMITADRNLIHATWEVRYTIEDPVAFVERTVDAETLDEGGMNALIRAALERTVVRTAARYTANEILLERSNAFRQDVRAGVRERLSEYGLDVVDVVTRGQPAPPATVVPAFAGRTTAVQELAQIQQKAESDRATRLTETAGQLYRKLRDMIDEYEYAGARKDQAELERLEGEIREFILTRAGGETARRINQARSEKTEIEQAAAEDLEKFEEILPEFRRWPGIVAANLVSDVRSRLFSSAMGKIHLPSYGTRVLEIQQPAEWQKQEETRSYLEGRLGP